MNVTLVRDDIAGLELDWSSLATRDSTTTPFSSFQWIAAWSRHWSGGGSPWVLVVRESERVVGLAPFVLHRRRGLRLLRGLGVGVGNYWDILAADEDRERVLAAVGSHLRERSSEWDALFVDKLPEESLTEAALGAAGLRIGWQARSPSPRIELPQTFDDFLARLSSNRRQKIRRNLRVIDSGELTVNVVSDPDRLKAAIDRWQALRVQWWAHRERALQAEHGSARFLTFTQEVVAALVPLGLAVVWEVRYRDEDIGVAINFLDDTSFYYWLWGFDLCVAKLRPGHVLLAYGIRWSVETGRRYFDFMIGDEAYKYDYAPAERAVLSLDIGNRSPRSRAVLGLSRLRHKGRSPADHEGVELRGAGATSA